MIRLGLNIDHVATLRQARYAAHPAGRGGIVEPDPVAFALESQRCGADGITVHPREDARHIQREDVRLLKAMLQIPLNLEMAASDDMFAFARGIAPATVCLVPEKRQEVTTEGGLDLLPKIEYLRKQAAELLAAGIHTSLFIDPDPAQVEAAATIGATYIELHTGCFANHVGTAQATSELRRLANAAAQAQALGLVVNLGHGINYSNIAQLRGIAGIHEMNIGHSIIARAVFDGLRCAVQSMKRLMNEQDA